MKFMMTLLSLFYVLLIVQLLVIFLHFLQALHSQASLTWIILEYIPLKVIYKMYLINSVHIINSTLTCLYKRIFLEKD